jgi:hypothetical protein
MTAVIEADMTADIEADMTAVIEAGWKRSSYPP